MKALKLLSQQEQKKLCALANEKQQAQLKLDQLATQQQALQQAATHYAQQRYCHANPMLLNNSVEMSLALEPIKKQLTRQQMLHTQEKQRVEKLWRRQLGRHLGLEVALENAHVKKQKFLAKQEQTQTDEFAGSLVS
ncbi:hypothetical protein JQC92_06175 [Shewanella sp. 202IG2-18]|uniref:hypothetical protein n=1 Tax=Parashewanella hymeniacidonis TaxID=2807618 RepID=UPI001961F1D5|nr:hypothetical protein [Parashewanella hymeniacidonis]MBM7071627.1 hypothetical protein [Parashewanella hymeniacidonis]